MSVTFPAAAALPPRLAVRPVRGYQAQADRLAAQLAALPGVSTGGPPPLESALAAAGRRAGDYSGRIDVDLDPAMPAQAAMAVVLTALLDTLEANVPGTIADTDTEFLHDLRVAVRRTRSALKLAGQVLPPGTRARFAPEFKWLGDLTTLTRDLDVYLLGLPAMTAGLVGAPPRTWTRSASTCGAAAPRPAGTCSAGCARPGSPGCARTGARSWRRPRERPRRKPPAADLAAASIAAAHRRVLAGGAAITPDSPPERLHDLRKRCKELRYALEIFASLHAPDAQWRAVRELKGLQDCLGEYQDTEVQRAELRAFAAQMMAQQSAPAATLLAMGEIAAGLARRERAARAEFDGLFRQFARPSGQARIQALTEQAGIDEDLRDLQHQGRRGQDLHRRQPGLPRGPRRLPGAAVGPGPAGRGQLPVPGPAAGQGRREGADPRHPAGRRRHQGHRLRRPGPAPGRLHLPQPRPHAGQRQEARPAAGQPAGPAAGRVRRGHPGLPAEHLAAVRERAARR